MLWTGIEGSDGDIYLGSGNDGRVLRIGARRHEPGVLRFQRARGPRAGARAWRRSLRRHVPRRPNLQGGQQPARAPSSSIRTRNTSGRSRSRRTVRSSPRPATRDSSTASRPTARDRSSTRRNRRTCDRCCSPHRASSWPAPNRPAACSGSARTAAASSFSTRAFRRSARLRAGPGGVVYAAAQTGKSSDDRPSSPPVMTDSPRQPPLPTVSTEITAVAVVGDQGSSGSGSPSRESGRASGKGAVYRIQPDGVWDQVWSSADDAPYDVALDGQGGLLVATGGKGKIYRVTGEPTESTLLTRAPAQQVTSLIADGARGLLITTANPGKILRLSADASTTRLVRVGRPRRRGRRHVGRDQLARCSASRHRRPPVHAHRQHRRAGRHVEPVVGRLPSAGGRADHQPEGALPAMEGRAHRGRQSQPRRHVGDRRVPAAQPASRDHVDHRSPAWRRLSAPVLDWRSRDRGLRRQHDRAARAERQLRRQSRARAARLPEGTADLPLEGAGSERRRSHLRHPLSARGRDELEGAEAQPDAIRSWCGTRRRCRTALT